MQSKKVIILGGGVAAMSAAHELIERGFQVELYEHRNTLGGKARSIKTKQGLYGEHGFRFFPGFYKHIIDTMERIPFKGKSVANNLISVPQQEAIIDGVDLKFDVPNKKDLKSYLSVEKYFMRMKKTLGITIPETILMSKAMWQIITSCKERRMTEYEKLSWWEFLDANRQSKNFQTLLEALTKIFVAAKARDLSVKTGGDIGLQLFLNLVGIGGNYDRILNGPTNETWIFPWRDYLQKKGVKFNLDSEVKRVTSDSDGDIRVIINKNGKSKIVNSKHVIVALPVEVACNIFDKKTTEKDSQIKNLKKLSTSISWMNGIQFFLKTEFRPAKGHSLFMDTPWALTSICQLQFWKNYDKQGLEKKGIKEILSVDISDWFTNGKFTTKKKASQCSKKEIIEETWAQLKESYAGKLKDEDLVDAFLDEDIIILSPNRPHKNVNLEPLLINKKNTWKLRPEAKSKIKGLYFASDYVRTNTDLATMEGANEAARRAVNAILQQENFREFEMCRIWDLHEPEIFNKFKKKDKERFDKGLPWNGSVF